MEQLKALTGRRSVINGSLLSLSVILIVSFIAPQIWLGMKYGGALGVIAVIGLGLVAYALAIWFSRGRRARSALAWICTSAFVAISTLALWVTYPIANSNNAVGNGGDADEAIQIATARLLAGLPPYAETTYLNNPITPFPGALILYAPGEIFFGATVWMSPLILAIACFLVSRSNPRAAIVLVISLVFSPMYWQSWVTGGDYVLLGLLAFAIGATVVRTQSSRWLMVGSVGLGVACASRPTMLLFVSGVFVVEYARGNMRRALIVGITAVVTGVVLTAVVYVWDPNSFTPFHVTSKSGGVVPGVTAVVLALAWQAGVFLVLRGCSTASGGRTTAGWRASLGSTGQLALTMGPAGFLLALPPAISFGQWYHLHYASFTSMVSPLGTGLRRVSRSSESSI